MIDYEFINKQKLKQTNIEMFKSPEELGDTLIFKDKSDFVLFYNSYIDYENEYIKLEDLDNCEKVEVYEYKDNYYLIDQNKYSLLCHKDYCSNQSFIIEEGEFIDFE